jgi:hypothetical protein
VPDDESPNSDRKTNEREALADDERHPSRRRRVVVHSPWKGGPGLGVGSFAIVFTVFYHVSAAGLQSSFGGTEADEPSQWIVAAFSMLSSAGGTLEYGGEPLEPGQKLPALVATDLMTAISILLLGAAGYLLVRYVCLETPRHVALALETATASYVALAVALATLARWSPE